MAGLTVDLFSMENLYLAYRKAKVDVFFERSQPMAADFCEYEHSLHANLTSLKGRLTHRKPTWHVSSDFIGNVGLIPKGLRISAHASDAESHFSPSDPDDAWKYALKRSGKEKPQLEFRPVAHFSVDMYVVCALWVNHIGHKFDACLSKCAYGTRLRRLKTDSTSPSNTPPFHLHAPGSFQPYFHAYRDWRDRGLRCIRTELSEGRRVVAMTMDLASFYHNVDASFLLDDSFLAKAKFKERNGAKLSSSERAFTSKLITAFKTWAELLPNYTADGPAGVPVGPSASRIIANVLLVEFDRLVEDRLTPIYYGRYVDDIFLVLRNNGTFDSAEKVTSYLARRIKPLTASNASRDLTLDLPYAGASKLVFKSEKQRVFQLSGEIGEDLLDAIEGKIDEVSSEWRLLPNIDDLERSPAARVLTAARKSVDDADSLRKADSLSLRRLGFSLMLRSVDALARDLPPDEWVAERRRFYNFALRHVVTPLRLFDLHDYLPRLVGVAVFCGDWKDATTIVKRLQSVLKTLRDKCVEAVS